MQLVWFREVRNWNWVGHVSFYSCWWCYLKNKNSIKEHRNPARF